MRVNIQEPIILNDLNDDQVNLLKDCSVWSAKENDTWTLQAQKIDLEENDMEEVLDVIFWCGPGNIILERYETGRYIIKITKNS